MHIRDADGHRNGPDGIEVTLEPRPAGGQPTTFSDSGSEAAAMLDGVLRHRRTLGQVVKLGSTS